METVFYSRKYEPHAGYQTGFNILRIVDFFYTFSAASEHEIHVNHAVEERTQLYKYVASNLV